MDRRPVLTSEERRRLFLEGIALFNRGAFFESHESWEEVWRSNRPEPRDLFQGLIQIAAGMHHVLGLGRATAARTTLAKGRSRLEPFAPASHGLDLASLLDAVRRWEAWLAEPEGRGRPAAPVLRVMDEEAVR